MSIIGVFSFFHSLLSYAGYRKTSIMCARFIFGTFEDAVFTRGLKSEMSNIGVFSFFHSFLFYAGYRKTLIMCARFIFGTFEDAVFSCVFKLRFLVFEVDVHFISAESTIITVPITYQ